MMVGDENKSCM